MQDKRASQTQFRSDEIARGLKRRVLLLTWCLTMIVTVLTNCQKQPVEPVALEPEDMCAYCKMAISEKRYAAELIDSEGAGFKFDDIGCMANFIKGQKTVMKVEAFYVTDFDDGQWIKADDAYFVRSSELATPMNGGIIAFKNQSHAQEAISKYSGKLLSFKDIFNL